MPELGCSREQATRRFAQNERALLKRGQWENFEKVVDEYSTLKHSELVPAQDMTKPEATCYYIPMHGVFKESSTTTQLRVVFDASAKSSTGHSLNDLLLPGPTLYPLLTSVLIRFRQHAIGLSSDITKMFREVSLHQTERDLH